MPNCNKSKWLHARIVVTQSWSYSNEIIFDFSVMETILTDLFLCNFETTQYKNHFDANFVQIHSAVIEISSVSCFMLF